MRKQPTEAQKAAAAERRAKFRALCNEIAAMTPERRAELATQSLIVTVEGRVLSGMNQLLVARQHATATMVGGFQQWRRAGRQVKKGEHGIAIWIPTGGRSLTTLLQYTEGMVESMADATERRGFIMGYVFDVSQTEEIAA